jgi:hypothetical protein
MEPKSREARNKIRRWTFNVLSTSSTGEQVASIAVPGFTIGLRAAAKQAAQQIEKTYTAEEAKREPIESKRFKFSVEPIAHERVNSELFSKFIEIEQKKDEAHKGLEIYRGLVMVACKELSERHPVELGKPDVVFRMLLQTFSTLAEGKNPAANIQLASAKDLSHLGIR